MDKLTVRQGETFQLPVTIDDESAESIRFTVWNEVATIIEEEVAFVDGEATIDAGEVTNDLGTYSYGVTIFYSDGAIDELPDVTGCDGDCEFPEFEICEGIPEGS